MELRKIPDTRNYYCDQTGVVYKYTNSQYKKLAVCICSNGYNKVYYQNKKGKSIFRSRVSLAQSLFGTVKGKGEHFFHKRKFTKEQIIKAYNECDNDVKKTALQLQCSPATVYRYLGNIPINQIKQNKHVDNNFHHSK